MFFLPGPRNLKSRLTVFLSHGSGAKWKGQTDKHLFEVWQQLETKHTAGMEMQRSRESDEQKAAIKQSFPSQSTAPHIHMIPGKKTIN